MCLSMCILVCAGGLTCFCSCSIAQALSCVSYDKTFPEALRVVSSGVKRSASLNLAAASLKLKDWKEAIKYCNKVVVVCGWLQGLPA